MEEVKSRRVKPHAKLTVVSSRPTGPGNVHKFNALGHAMGLHRVQMVFYYSSNPFDHGPMESDLDNLRVSLSELLCMYPAVTGRMARDESGNWEVKCNDAGVRMARASVGTRIDEWLRSADATEEKDLTLWEDMPDDPNIWSPFRIQINDFEGGGLAIGISCLHTHADAATTALLTKSWSEIHRGEPITHPPIFHLPAPPYSQSLQATNTKSATHYANKSKQELSTIPKMASATFRFPSSVIEKQLSQVYETCPDATPFDLLAGLLWSRIARLKASGDDGKHTLSLCVDMRSHGKRSVPFGYFGNAIYFSALSVDAQDLKDDDISNVVLLMHQHVKRIEEEEFWSAIAWLESRKGENGQFPPPFRMYGPELTCVCMEDDTLMYEAKFKEDEKPVHVSCHVKNVEGEGLILVMPSPEGGFGRTVMVTLPAEQIGCLCEDEAILELEPTILIRDK